MVSVCRYLPESPGLVTAKPGHLLQYSGISPDAEAPQGVLSQEKLYPG